MQIMRNALHDPRELSPDDGAGEKRGSDELTPLLAASGIETMPNMWVHREHQGRGPRRRVTHGVSPEQKDLGGMRYPGHCGVASAFCACSAVKTGPWPGSRSKLQATSPRK